MEIEKKKFENKKILFLIHDHADPDAVGSAYYLSVNSGGDVASPSSASATGKNLLSFLEFPLKHSIDIHEYDLFVVLDTPDPSQLAPFDLPLEKAFVIDHHSSNSWEDVDVYQECRTSCAEIVYEMVGPETLSRKEGIALAAGIFTDSSSLQRADHKTLLCLSEILEKSGVTLREVKDLLFESRSYSEKIARLKGAKRVKFTELNGFILASTEIGSFEGSVASYILNAGADIVLVLNSISKNRSRITARASEEVTEMGIDLGKIFERIIDEEKEVDGGGHPGAAVLKVSRQEENRLKTISRMIMSEIRERELGREKY